MVFVDCRLAVLDSSLRARSLLTVRAAPHARRQRAATTGTSALTPNP